VLEVRVADAAAEGRAGGRARRGEKERGERRDAAREWK
jgi:hypothetical protein